MAVTVEPKKISHAPSPNCGKRPAGVQPDAIILHGTAGTDAGDLAWLRKPESRVSYHYLVWRDGTIWQLVREADRAWHAGKSRLYDRENCNDFSIGVAFSLRPTEYVSDAQYDAAAWLCADIWRRRGIGFERIAEHRAVSPGRKLDLWGRLDVPRLFRAIAHYRYPPPEPFPPEIVIPKAA